MNTGIWLFWEHEQCHVGIPLGPLKLLRHDGWLSFSTWNAQHFVPPICMLINCCPKTMNNAKLNICERPRLRQHDGWWSFSESVYHQIISSATWIYRAAYHFVPPLCMPVYCSSETMKKAMSGHFWDPLGRCSTRADFHFLRAHGLKLHSRYIG